MADEIKRLFSDPARQNQVFPVTHERAVRDDDGTTLESKLEDMHAENVAVVNEAREAAEQIIRSSGIIFDISVYNANPNPIPYGDLVTALSGIPANYRQSGMTVRFINSTINKYEQYRYLLSYENTTAGNTAFVNTDNWVTC